MPETNTKAVASSLRIARRHTQPGVSPYEEIVWEQRTARVGRPGETPRFEQHGVEVPEFWSQNATDIVAQKYFAYDQSDARRESSVRQLIDRVVKTIGAAGMQPQAETGRAYFTDEAERETFEAELTHILIHQKAAFNSPVWFNIGVDGAAQQSSACFILAVEDSLDSISKWQAEEARIFKRGSGAGVNLSNLRGSMEKLALGGTSSGPVTFMRGADANAGTIQSGGTTRRAAKLVALDIDHPDVEDFIVCKAREEDRIRALQAAGFEIGIGTDVGEKNLAEATAYQNANNSVRVTQAFLDAVAAGGDWQLKARGNGATIKTLPARTLMRKIAEAAWRCADPGMQYDTTINDWHTTPAQGRITASNPCCFTGETLVDTSEGKLSFTELQRRQEAGIELPDALTYSPAERLPLSGSIVRVWVAGETTRLVEVRTQRGHVLRCTPEHRFLTHAGEYVEAQNLVEGTRLRGRLTYQEEVVSVTVLELTEAQPVYDLEVAYLHCFGVASVDDASSVIVHNSEYMSNDDTSCNLASLNLLKFLRPDGSFDSEDFQHCTRIMFTAQDITISFGDFPTELIGDNTRKLRQLGTGFANLGALLMAMGLPYDSDEGRALAAAITALMTGECYLQSTHLAERVGAFCYYEENAAPMMRVMRKHRTATKSLSCEQVALVQAARTVWNAVVRRGREVGFRNAQASCCAPTGTIAFMMDCDTTGVEPDFSLIKGKTMAGGGQLLIPNLTLPIALKKLGYSAPEVDEILAYVAEEVDKDGGYRGPRGTVSGAPHLQPEHYPVFDCAIGERAISWRGHVDMMAACQPFLSGAISKTINLPESATIDEHEEVFLYAGAIGLKAVALYRDNCKAFQPLSDSKFKDRDAEVEKAVEERRTSILGDGLLRGERRKVPRTAVMRGISFDVGMTSGYISVREFEDGRPGAIFIDVGQAGSTLAGFIKALSVTMSLGFQYGMALDILVSKLVGMQFEPYGFTDDPDIRQARSLVDYIVKWLAIEYLDPSVQPVLGIGSAAPPEAVETAETGETDTELDGIAPRVEVRALTRPTAHADTRTGLRLVGLEKLCDQCGGLMQPTGACYTCTRCGSSSGGCG